MYQHKKVDYCTTLYNNSYHNLNSVEPTLQFNDKSAVKSLISKDSFIKSLSSILLLATTEGLLNYRLLKSVVASDSMGR